MLPNEPCRFRDSTAAWSAGLTQAIDVDDGAEIVEAFERRPLGRLPDRAFCGFAIAHQNENPLSRMVESFRFESHPDADGQALTERTGGDVHKRQQGSGVPLQVRVDLAQ